MFRLREILKGMPEAERPSLLGLAKATGLSYGSVHSIYANKAIRADLGALQTWHWRRSLASPPRGELIGPGKGPRRGRKRGRG